MKNNKNTNKTSNFNAQERKNLQNKIYTWLIFALIVFWTISSILGIAGFCTAVSAKAESTTVCVESIDDSMESTHTKPVSKRLKGKSMRYGEENAIPYSAEDFGSFEIPLPIFDNYGITTFFLWFTNGVPTDLYNAIYDYGEAVELIDNKYVCDFEDVHIEIVGYVGYEEYPISVYGCSFNNNATCYSLNCSAFLGGYEMHDFDIYFWKGNLNPLEQSFTQDYTGFASSILHYFSLQKYNDFIALFNEYNQGGGGASEEELEQAYNNGFTAGKQEGYTEGIQYGKYGPFTDLGFYCIVYDLQDEQGNIIAERTPLLVNLSAEALFTMGFNSEPVLQDIVAQLRFMYSNLDNWGRIEMHFEFSQPFAQKQYPLLFDGNSTCFYGTVKVVYPDTSFGTYSFVAQDNGTWTLPVPNDIFIEEIVWDIGGGYDGFSFTVYVQGQSYQEGFNAGSAVGYDNGYNRGNQIGYENGFVAGKAVGYNEGSLANNNFLSLLTAVVDAPLKVFYDAFNFELLGYNMSSFFLALLSACFVLVILKLILGR